MTDNNTEEQCKPDPVRAKQREFVENVAESLLERVPLMDDHELSLDTELIYDLGEAAKHEDFDTMSNIDKQYYEYMLLRSMLTYLPRDARQRMFYHIARASDTFED